MSHFQACLHAASAAAATATAAGAGFVWLTQVWFEPVRLDWTKSGGVEIKNFLPVDFTKEISARAGGYGDIGSFPIACGICPIARHVESGSLGREASRDDVTEDGGGLVES